MSSWREVLIRILALLQRKKLIKPKNRTLKCLKRHYLTVRSMKNVGAMTEDGAFALFFRPKQASHRFFFFLKIIADCRATVRFSTTAATGPGNTAFKVSENTSNLTNSRQSLIGEDYSFLNASYFKRLSGFILKIISTIYLLIPESSWNNS